MALNAGIPAESSLGSRHSRAPPGACDSVFDELVKSVIRFQLIQTFKGHKPLSRGVTAHPLDGGGAVPRTSGP